MSPANAQSIETPLVTVVDPTDREIGSALLFIVFVAAAIILIKRCGK